jgi:site-specific DNA recombinase
VVTVEVPPLIDQATFDAVQAHLRSRNPKVTPARIVSGPALLTGICFCADCQGAMTLWTGKGGRYRYYTCSTPNGWKRSWPTSSTAARSAQSVGTNILPN